MTGKELKSRLANLAKICKKWQELKHPEALPVLRGCRCIMLSVLGCQYTRFC